MGKEIKFKIENEKLILLEDAHKDDYILLEKIEAYSSHFQKIIDEQVKKAEENSIKIFKDSEEYKELQSERDQLNNEVKDLNNQIKHLEEVSKIEKEGAINQFKATPEFMNLTETKIKLEADNKQLSKQIQALSDKYEIDLKNERDNNALKLKNAINEFKLGSEYLGLINEKEKLSLQLANLENKHKNDLELQEMKLLNSDEFKAKDEKIKYLEDEINLLKRNKSLMGIKVLGNELENWSLHQYQNQLGLIFPDSNFVHARNIDGTLPDFIFTVYDQPLINLKNDQEKQTHLISKTILEMKTEMPDSQSSNLKSNAYHLKKLESDRLKNNADYALLVTELEKEHEFVIYIDPQYPNIFIVRPSYFIYLLMLIHNFAIKDLELKRQLNNEKIFFNDAQDILKTFRELQNGLIDETIKNIRNNVEDIVKQAEKLEDIASKINKSANVVLTKHLNTIVNKIDNFPILKTTRRISNLNATEITTNAQPVLNKHFETDDDELITKEITKTKVEK